MLLDVLRILALHFLALLNHDLRSFQSLPRPPIIRILDNWDPFQTPVVRRPSLRTTPRRPLRLLLVLPKLPCLSHGVALIVAQSPPPPFAAPLHPVAANI